MNWDALRLSVALALGTVLVLVPLALVMVMPRFSASARSNRLTPTAMPAISASFGSRSINALSISRGPSVIMA